MKYLGTLLLIFISESREYEVALVPRFILGVGQFRELKKLNPYHRSACPSNRQFCVDSRDSDSMTCMWPSPMSVKVCLDESCRSILENNNIFKTIGEDSYCKHDAASDGRVCQWTTDIYCTCNKFSVIYTDAISIGPDDVPPLGYMFARDCEYPDDYKAENYREDDDQPIKALRPLALVGSHLNSKNASEIMKTSFPAVILTILLPLLLLFL